jgi:hypothetical protein
MAAVVVSVAAMPIVVASVAVGAASHKAAAEQDRVAGESEAEPEWMADTSGHSQLNAYQSVCLMKKLSRAASLAEEAWVVDARWLPGTGQTGKTRVYWPAFGHHAALGMVPERVMEFRRRDMS